MSVHPFEWHWQSVNGSESIHGKNYNGFFSVKSKTTNTMTVLTLSILKVRGDTFNLNFEYNYKVISLYHFFNDIYNN